MNKKMCMTAVGLVLYAASCMGQTNHPDGLSQLCEVYRQATSVLNHVKTVDEAGSAMDSLTLLLRNNKENPAICEVCHQTLGHVGSTSV